MRQLGGVKKDPPHLMGLKRDGEIQVKLERVTEPRVGLRPHCSEPLNLLTNPELARGSRKRGKKQNNKAKKKVPSGTGTPLMTSPRGRV